MQRFVLLLVLCTIAVAARVNAQSADVYDERYRPQFHFSAKKGWLNDPNGLVFMDGQYHMFYQHNPFGEGWGNMTWGHATSPDLVHWTEHSPALAADPIGVKFSGTAVIDHNNSAGLQTGATPTMALFYTSVGGFDQRMAYSTDGGRSFRYSAENPVLPSQSGGDDRDPQVFWHEQSQKWIQVLWVAPHNGNPQSFQFFGSTNLTDWTYLSENRDFFECPDFFELPVDGNANNTRWVMYGADGGYQVGQFNGTAFTSQTPGRLTQDFGNTFYASQTWHDIPSDDGRRIQVGWMNGGQFPGMPFNQQMSFPVELTLRQTSDGIRMFRNPVEEIALLHQNEFALQNVVYGPGQDPLGNLSGDLFHIIADIELNTATSVGFNIRGQQVRYDVASQTLAALGRSAPLAATNGRVQLELLLDRTSLELFGGNGRVSMTSSFLPAANNMAIDLFATGGNARVVSLSAFELGSAWPDEQPTPGEGLLGQWKFDEPSLAANFINSAGPEYDLANSSVVSAVSGVAGNAARFDNTGDHAYIPNHEGLNSDSFTVSLWLRPEAPGAGGHVIGKTHEQTETWGIQQMADGRLRFSVATGNNTVDELLSNVALTANQWNHAVASYDAQTGRMELYLDGEFAGASELTIDGRPNYDDSPLMVGQRRIGGDMGSVRGSMDELQIYGSALSAGQIRYLHDHPALGIDPTTFDPSQLTLQIDPSTGAATIVSASSSPVQLKGYSILSTTGSLSVGQWESLDGNPMFNGWNEANPNGAALNELNPLGSTTIGTSTMLDLGNPIAVQGPLPFGTRAANLDVSFQYLTASGQVMNGNVEVVGALAINNLLLEVDSATGQVVLSNASGETVRLAGYSILSDSGSLLPQNGNWHSLSDQVSGIAEEANVSSEHLSEFALPLGPGIVLLPGQSYSLGEAFSIDGGMQDLKLEFVRSVPASLGGDFNQDGIVDAADYTVWRDTLGLAVRLPNEQATIGQVTAEDLDVWRANFGATAALTLALIDGEVRYINSAASIATGQVPEPATLVPFAVVAFTLAGHQRLSSRKDNSLCRV